MISSSWSRLLFCCQFRRWSFASRTLRFHTNSRPLKLISDHPSHAIHPAGATSRSCNLNTISNFNPFPWWSRDVLGCRDVCLRRWTDITIIMKVSEEHHICEWQTTLRKRNILEGSGLVAVNLEDQISGGGDWKTGLRCTPRMFWKCQWGVSRDRGVRWRRGQRERANFC